MPAITLYVVAILLANVLTANYSPIHYAGFIVPVGTFLIGITFFLRDLVQHIHGKRIAYLSIILAMILSAMFSYGLGDTLWIVVASAVSFIISETSDTEVYSRLKKSATQRVLYSGIVGGILDSSIFVIVGLSPVGAGFVPWEAVPYAICGQILVKSLLQVGACLVVALHSKKEAR